MSISFHPPERVKAKPISRYSLERWPQLLIVFTDYILPTKKLFFIKELFILLTTQKGKD